MTDHYDQRGPGPSRVQRERQRRRRAAEQAAARRAARSRAAKAAGVLAVGLPIGPVLDLPLWLCSVIGVAVGVAAARTLRGVQP